jgi:hypothetical protein
MSVPFALLLAVSLSSSSFCQGVVRKPSASAAKPGHSIVVPAVKDDGTDALKALKAIAPKFAEYAPGNLPGKLELPAMSLGVVSGASTIWEEYVGNGQVGARKVTLDDKTKQDMAFRLSHSIGKYLSARIPLSDSARVELIVLTQPDDSMYLDSNSYAHGHLGGMLLLLDTTSKKLIWWAKCPSGTGIDPGSAAVSLSEEAQGTLGNLFGKLDVAEMKPAAAPRFPIVGAWSYSDSPAGQDMVISFAADGTASCTMALPQNQHASLTIVWTYTLSGDKLVLRVKSMKALAAADSDASTKSMVDTVNARFQAAASKMQGTEWEVQWLTKDSFKAIPPTGKTATFKRKS